MRGKYKHDKLGKISVYWTWVWYNRNADSTFLKILVLWIAFPMHFLATDEPMHLLVQPSAEQDFTMTSEGWSNCIKSSGGGDLRPRGQRQGRALRWSQWRSQIAAYNRSQLIRFATLRRPLHFAGALLLSLSQTLAETWGSQSHFDTKRGSPARLIANKIAFVLS